MRLLRKSHENQPINFLCAYFTPSSLLTYWIWGWFFLHSLHKGLEFRHLLPYCPKSWNMNFWRINASLWSRNLYEVALWFYKAEFFRVSICYCIPCFFLCVQLLINAPTRKHEFERQILLTWIDSALQKRTESIKTILWNGMVSYINFWPQCALGLLASVLWR